LTNNSYTVTGGDNGHFTHNNLGKAIGDFFSRYKNGDLPTITFLDSGRQFTVLKSLCSFLETMSQRTFDGFEKLSISMHLAEMKEFIKQESEMQLTQTEQSGVISTITPNTSGRIDYSTGYTGGVILDKEQEFIQPNPMAETVDKLAKIVGERSEEEIVEDIIVAETYHKDSGSRNYYKDLVPGYEYFQLMEHLLGHDGFIGHARGQIFKYNMRFGKKDNLLSEITKVAWYAAYLKEYLERYEQGLTPYKPS
jgi:hypothetical protein